MPERPAVAGDRPLHLRADLVDRALRAFGSDRAVGPHFRLMARGGIIKHRTRRDQSKLDEGAERDALLGALAFGDLKRGAIERCERVEPCPRRVGVSRVALDADEGAPEPLGGDRGRAGAEKRIEHDVAFVARGKNDAVEQGLGLLRRVGLAPAIFAQALGTRADGKQPVRAHLQIVVQGLHRIVIEGVARLGSHRRPDQRLMRIGEAPPAKVRHGIGLAPDHVVEHPEAEILQRRADAEDVVIAADDPQRAGWLQHAAAGGKPVAGEGVVGGEASELVPIVVDGVDAAVVGPEQLAVELKIIGRIGEDEIDRCFGEAVERLDAIADDDAIERELGPRLFPRTHDFLLGLRND